MGTYIAQSNIEDQFGTVNVARWSNLDNTTTTADTDRITAAIAWAETRVSDRFRYGPYTLPFSPITDVVKGWCAVLAGWWLYNARGTRDEDDVSPIDERRAEVESEMNAYLAGRMRMECAVSHSGPSAPVVV